MWNWLSKFCRRVVILLIMMASESSKVPFYCSVYIFLFPNETFPCLAALISILYGFDRLPIIDDPRPRSRKKISLREDYRVCYLQLHPLVLKNLDMISALWFFFYSSTTQLWDFQILVLGICLQHTNLYWI